MAISDGTILRIVASLLFPENVIAQNVFYAVFADTGTSDDEDDVVLDLADWIEAAYVNITGRVAQEIDLTGIKVYEYDPIDTDWDEVGEAVINYDFTGTGDMSAHGVCFVIHAKTTDPDVQAAKFMGGVSDTQIEDGLFIAATINDMALFADDWATPFVGTATGADFAPGVWSPTHTNFFLFNGTEVLNTIPGYQRRRKPGVGI